MAWRGRELQALCREHPGGQVLARGSPTEEEVLVVDVDLLRARDKRITARNDRLADRRPELYGLPESPRA